MFGKHFKNKKLNKILLLVCICFSIISPVHGTQVATAKAKDAISISDREKSSCSTKNEDRSDKTGSKSAEGGSTSTSVDGYK